MPGKGFKSVTVRENSHKKAVELSRQDSTSISSVYERCVDQEYSKRMIIETSSKLQVEPTFGGAMRGLESTSPTVDIAALMRGNEDFNVRLSEIKDSIEYKRTALENDNENATKKMQLATVLLDLGELYSEMGAVSEAIRTCTEASELYDSVGDNEPVDVDMEDQKNRIDILMQVTKSIQRQEASLNLVLTADIPGKDPMVLGKFKVGDAASLLPVAAELLKATKAR